MARVNALELLPDLYGQVFAPPAVYGEVTNPGRLGAAELARAPWLIVRPPSDTEAVSRLRHESQLDAGEAEAIILASELGARLVIDERRGDRIARNRGIPVSGVAAVVAVAARTGRIAIDEVEPILRRMVAAKVHLSDRVIRDAVALAGEKG